MFALSNTDLHRKILDCPGGAASLTAEVGRGGGDATACDPFYAGRDTDELALMAEAESIVATTTCVPIPTRTAGQTSLIWMIMTAQEVLRAHSLPSTTVPTPNDTYLAAFRTCQSESGASISSSVPTFC